MHSPVITERGEESGAGKTKCQHYLEPEVLVTVLKKLLEFTFQKEGRECPAYPMLQVLVSTSCCICSICGVGRSPGRRQAQRALSLVPQFINHPQFKHIYHDYIQPRPKMRWG